MREATLAKRATPIGTSVGCFVDAPSPSGRVLAATYVAWGNMSLAVCTTYCTSKGYRYGGVEYTNECWCGNELRTGTYTGANQDSYMSSPVNYGVRAPSSDCNMPCSGDKSQTCGGHWRLNTYILPDCLPSQTAFYGNKNQTLCCNSGQTAYQTKCCDAGSTETNASGLCCKSGTTAQRTVCCGSGLVEIGSTGVCCASGSTVVSGKCVAPSGRTRRSVRRLLQKVTGPPPSASQYGLEANRNEELCPAGFAACPVDPTAGHFEKTGAYECLDTRSELQSCGGCASLGTGTDCTRIKGALSMGCEEGRCQVHRCKKGWKVGKDGASCVRRL